MAESTIEWTHYTFNPWLGCAKVHAGCTHCYAEKSQPVVMRAGGGVGWGEVWQGGQRVVVSDSTWKKPLQWAREAARAAERRRVFCASLADVLEVPREPESWPRTWGAERIQAASNAVIETGNTLAAARERLWGLIRQTASVCGECGQRESSHVSRGFCARTPLSAVRRLGGLDWLLLTKRPENWALVPEHVRPLVWLGTSISDQKTADEWVPRLLEAEGFRLRFLSVEPLVGPVDLGAFLPPDWDPHYGIDWVIVGGESGPKARPCHVDWVRDLVRQCREAGVPCFVKQLGGAPATSIAPTGNFRTNPETGRRQIELAVSPLDLTDPKGGDMAEWPEDLRVREFPEVRHA